MRPTYRSIVEITFLSLLVPLFLVGLATAESQMDSFASYVIDHPLNPEKIEIASMGRLVPDAFDTVLYVPSTTEYGVTYNAPSSGSYRFTITAGAYSPWPAGHPDDEGWITGVFFYKNRSVEWVERVPGSLHPGNYDFFTGSLAFQPTYEEAEAMAEGMFVDIQLEANEYVILIVRDDKTYYYDNRGGMYFSISMPVSISGYVRFEDNTPIANVVVQARKGDEVKGFGTTNNEGYYEIENLPSDTYKIRACFDNNGDLVCNYHNASNPSVEDVEVTAGIETSDIDITFPLPVVLVYGWNANASKWNAAKNYFQNDPATRTGDMLGTKGHICFAANNINGFGCIGANAERLRSYIESSVVPSFSPRLPLINIVAHSMGGLIARKYIHEYVDGYNIEKLVMLGTPNAGVKKAWLLFPVCAARNMTIHAMRRFNSIVTDEKYATFYYIAGRGGDDDTPPTGCAYPHNHTDGFIGEWSVFKCFSRSEYCFPDAKHNDLRDKQPYIGDILKILEGKAFSTPCNEPLAGAGWSDYQEEGIQLSGAISDSIFQGETKQYQFIVDACEWTTLTVDWVFGELNLTLRDPNGSIIDSSTAAGDTNIQYLPYDPTDPLLEKGYIIKNPLAGIWTLEVSVIDAPSDSAIPFFVMATLENDLSLSITTDKEYYPQGGTVLITASLSENGAPKTGANIYARIIKPNYSSDSLSLFDDGAHGDGSSDDGVYGNSYTNTSTGGRYFLSVTASGLTTGGHEFQRQEILEFDVNPNTAHFTGSYSDQGIDVNGDGYFDSLRIEVGLQINNIGDYEIVASLEDRNSTQIDVAHCSEKDVSAGAHTFILDFSGQKIKENGVDGPYYLRDLGLFDETDILLQADYVEDAYTTSPYTIDQFTSVEEEEVVTPQTFSLFQNYPNPFNPQTIIEYVLPKNTYVRLTLYNILGQKVRTLVDEPKRAGSYEVIWDGKDDQRKEVGSGIYFYQLRAGDYTETKKMILVK